MRLGPPVVDRAGRWPALPSRGRSRGVDGEQRVLAEVRDVEVQAPGYVKHVATLKQRAGVHPVMTSNGDAINTRRARGLAGPSGPW